MGDILCALRSTLWSGSLGHHMNSFTHRCRNPKLKNPDVTVIMLASHHIRKSRMQSSITYLAKAWSQGNNAIVDGAGVVFVSALWWSRDEKSGASKWTNESGVNIRWSDDRVFPSLLPHFSLESALWTTSRVILMDWRSSGSTLSMDRVSARQDGGVSHLHTFGLGALAGDFWFAWHFSPVWSFPCDFRVNARPSNQFFH